MNRAKLIKLLEKNGWQFLREGRKHTIFEKDGEQEQIPRHKEIKELLAKSIIKKRNLK